MIYWHLSDIWLSFPTIFSCVEKCSAYQMNQRKCIILKQSLYFKVKFKSEFAILIGNSFKVSENLNSLIIP